MIKTQMTYLIWIPADGQGSIPMGAYASEAEAEAAIDDARQELLNQCGTEAEREGVEAGQFVVEVRAPRCPSEDAPGEATDWYSLAFGLGK